MLECNYYNVPEHLMEKGGLKAALEAKKQGKIRFIGFTGHKDPRIHLHMLEVAKEYGFEFDTVQMPLNVMDAHYRSFEKMVLLTGEFYIRFIDQSGCLQCVAGAFLAHLPAGDLAQLVFIGEKEIERCEDRSERRERPRSTEDRTGIEGGECAAATHAAK